MKIRTAIFGVYAAASAVGLAVLMRFMLGEVRPRYVDSLQRTLGETSRVLAAVLSARPALADPSAPTSAAALGWPEEFAALRAVSPGLRVRVRDGAGRVVFDSQDAASVASDGDGELSAAAPILSHGRELGTVVVSRPLRNVNEFVWSERRKLATVALLVAGAMLVAGWWISAKLTHSLERLTAYALAVRDGQHAGPPASRAKEIAALGRAFEEMRTALEGKAHVERYTQALAHEIKAPLAAIRGAAELLGEDMPREERARFLANLRNESARIQQIVDRLLELSALEARHGRLTLAVTDLRTIVREVHAGALGVAEVREISLSFPADGVAVNVSGEKFLLVQAVSNLVQNALEFTPSGGAISLAVEVEHGTARVTVADSGPGVPDYALEKVFDRFYSLPRPDTGRKSTGLGLSIVREIARLHGGDVTLSNRVDGGAYAVLTLPVVRSA